MTTFQRITVAALIFSTFAGCDPGAPNVTPGPETPHGGTLFPLPDNQGFVELVKERVPGPKPQSRIVAYFLDSNRDAQASAPTAVSLQLTAGGAPVDFVQTADITKAGGFASPPIADRDDLAGEFSATIAGKPITITIGLR